MKRIILVVIAVAILITVGYFVVFTPLSLLDVGTSTRNTHVGNLIGYGELIGPRERKGFITSYMNEGFSETVTLIGKCQHKTQGTIISTGFEKYRYTVYGKENTWSSYEVLSKPGQTSRYISIPNPGEVKTSSAWIFGGIWNCPAYSFEVVGSKYKALKVIFEGYIDWNTWNPFDDGWKWRTLQVDEAYLYEGYGSLRLPTGIEDDIERPYDTFEIGETVDIRVETGKGGQTVDGTGTWRVTLNEPYSGGITEPGIGGGVVKEEYYNDDAIGHFKFVVTEEMARKSMESTDPYTVRLWNTILPIGTLYVDFLDFIALAPSDVTCKGPEQIKVGNVATITLSASVNPSTQASLDYFRVSVIYGTSGVLLPSDWGSKLWLIHTTNIPASSGTATISFIPQKESFVTVHAKAFDTDGRGSKRTITWTLWTYADSEVPDEVIEDETGQHDYWGGKTPEYQPWDPSGWWEDNVAEYYPLIVALAVFIIMMIIAFIPQIPIPYGMYGRLAVVTLGAVLAALIYWLMGGTI